MKLMCVSVGGAADAVHSGDGGVGSAWGWQPTRCAPHGTTPSHYPTVRVSSSAPIDFCSSIYRLFFTNVET